MDIVMWRDSMLVLDPRIPEIFHIETATAATRRLAVHLALCSLKAFVLGKAMDGVPSTYNYVCGW